MVQESSHNYQPETRTITLAFSTETLNRCGKTEESRGNIVVVTAGSGAPTSAGLGEQREEAGVHNLEAWRRVVRRWKPGLCGESTAWWLSLSRGVYAMRLVLRMRKSLKTGTDCCCQGEVALPGRC